MARPSEKLIKAIRQTAQNLHHHKPYQWGHMGACNCGNLAQELTHLSKAEIHAYAMSGYGDWSEQVAAFCPTSQMPMDLLINELIAAGLTLEDLINLERLKDEAVLNRLQRPHLRYNDREDVAQYLETWADLLEEKLIKKQRAEKMLAQI